MTDETTTPENEQMFPTLSLINDQFLGEDGAIDVDGLTTEQLLSAVREAFFMTHTAITELQMSMSTMGLLMGHLDDRVESGLTAEAPPAQTSKIVIPKLSIEKQ
jgi:hypothetical protein